MLTMLMSILKTAKNLLRKILSQVLNNIFFLFQFSTHSGFEPGISRLAGTSYIHIWNIKYHKFSIFLYLFI